MGLLKLPPREALPYAACYCEENIYKIVELHIPPASLKHSTVLFLSNPAKAIPVFSQKLQTVAILPVIWDYHVILVYHPGRTLEDLLQAGSGLASDRNEGQSQGIRSGTYVYDFDSTIPEFPCSFTSYFSQTFSPPSQELFESPSDRLYMLEALDQDRFKRFFRLVPAELYLQHFSSSREHMKDHLGNWNKPLPEWEIINLGKKETFKEYIDFTGCQGSERKVEKGREYLGIIVGERGLWDVFGDGGRIPNSEDLEEMNSGVGNDGGLEDESNGSPRESVTREHPTRSRYSAGPP
ncbi:hypothetical protein ABW19_dt0205249 [Dactylella cylindrospora]|nr:hypothetical protein ABW19_dt0205249 [Dactylella cylindrospora]